jgi:hypothetical protein
MTQGNVTLTRRRLTTPRAAAIAGILFAVLFSISIVLMRLFIPADLSDSGWLETGAGRVSLALGLMPFAGIAFLWFVGVVRDRLGEFEDQFFATVFFGSGLLFLAMTFAASAIAGGILASYARETSQLLGRDVYVFGRAVMSQIFNVYALRMAGVFMISLGTIWLRTRLMPRWVPFITYLVALVLLLIVSLSLWVVLIFPGWVFLVSVYILVLNVRRPSSGAADGLTSGQPAE